MSERGEGCAVAVIGLFEGPEALLRAARTLRERGIGGLEAFTPYPVHGLVQALGQKPSPLGAMVLAMGIIGALSALAFQWWTSVVDYPIPTGGKALFSWQAFVPVMFEVMVLFTAFTAGLGMLLLLNRLPYFGDPMLRSRAMGAVTRDRFALAIRLGTGSGEAAEAESALLDAGAAELETLCHEADPPRVFRFAPITALALACSVAGVATYWGVKAFPVVPPMNAMERQGHAVPFRASSFFADGRVMREPAEGTVARGHLPLPAMTDEEAGSLLANPLVYSDTALERGRAKYGIHCQVCHGALGDGKAELPATYGAKPANLQSASIREFADGRLFHVISAGKNTMPGYASDISPDDRWAIILYLRALQRGQNARPEDLP
jgi:mono/diheme cytochrome c family protein